MKKFNKKEYNKFYYNKHREQFKIKSKKYRNTHKKEIYLNHKLYEEKNKLILQQKRKIYYQKNKTKILARNKQYSIINKDKIRKQKRYYIKNYKKINLNFKLLENLRCRIFNALRNNYKSKSTIKLIGCSIEQLKNHLEKQFKPGMTWNNHSVKGWHIDHIKPCASFDLSKPSEQRKCFHYTNLQPLWAKENLEKRNKTMS